MTASKFLCTALRRLADDDDCDCLASPVCCLCIVTVRPGLQLSKLDRRGCSWWFCCCNNRSVALVLLHSCHAPIGSCNPAPHTRYVTPRPLLPRLCRRISAGVTTAAAAADGAASAAVCRVASTWPLLLLTVCVPWPVWQYWAWPGTAAYATFSPSCR